MSPRLFVILRDRTVTDGKNGLSLYSSIPRLVFCVILRFYIATLCILVLHMMCQKINRN